MIVPPSLGVVKAGVPGERAVFPRVSNFFPSEQKERKEERKKRSSSGCEKLNLRGSDSRCMQTCSGPFMKNTLWDSGGPVEGQFTAKAPLRL